MSREFCILTVQRVRNNHLVSMCIPAPRYAEDELPNGASALPESEELPGERELHKREIRTYPSLTGCNLYTQTEKILLQHKKNPCQRKIIRHLSFWLPEAYFFLTKSPSYCMQHLEKCYCEMFQCFVSNYSFWYHLLGYEQGESEQKRQGELREGTLLTVSIRTKETGCLGRQCGAECSCLIGGKDDLQSLVILKNPKSINSLQERKGTSKPSA